MAACEFPLLAPVWRTVSGPGGITYPFPRPPCRSNRPRCPHRFPPFDRLSLTPSSLYPAHSGSLPLSPSPVPLTSLLPSSPALPRFSPFLQLRYFAPTFPVHPHHSTEPPTRSLVRYARNLPSVFSVARSSDRSVGLARVAAILRSFSDSSRRLSPRPCLARVRGGRRHEFTSRDFGSARSVPAAGQKNSSVFAALHCRQVVHGSKGDLIFVGIKKKRKEKKKEKRKVRESDHGYI